MFPLFWLLARNKSAATAEDRRKVYGAISTAFGGALLLAVVLL